MTIPPLAPESCMEVGPGCPVEGTPYGYYPSLGANAFFAAFFGLCFFVQIVFGIKYKTWTYIIALGLGCAGEVAGYGGRLMMHNNPFSGAGFQLQICLLIISPAFVSAGIYITLKHIVINFGEEQSRLRPAWYTYIFITGDIISLLLQGAGGGIAVSADNGSSLQDVGTNLMIAGVIFQVVILAVFGYFLGEYTLRTYRRRSQLSDESMRLFNKTGFRCFVFAIVLAYLGIFIRCIYRIPELTNGWRSELMRNETDFIVLEGVMIVMSVLVLTVFHPGYCFPALGICMVKGKRMYQPCWPWLPQKDITVYKSMFDYPLNVSYDPCCIFYMTIAVEGRDRGEACKVGQWQGCKSIDRRHFDQFNSINAKVSGLCNRFDSID